MATQQKKGNDFIWFDRQAELKANEAGDTTYVPGRKGAISSVGKILSGVGNALSVPYGTGDPNYALKQNQLDAEQQQNDLVMQQRVEQIVTEKQNKNRYSELLKEMEAKAKLGARLKQQQGVALSDYEKDLVGYKDPNQPPSDFDLWRTAQKQAVMKLGGSDMVGLQPDKTAALAGETQREYLELKKQFGTETPDEKLQRAKLYLKQNGYASTNETASMLLKQNENF